MGTFTGGGCGNLTHDPEYKQFDNGAMCTLRVAFNDSYKDRNQQKVEVTTYLDCVVNGGAVDACMNSLRKGSKVYVTGTLAEDNWDDRQSGQKRTKHKLKRCHVEFLDPNPNSGGGGYSNQGQSFSNNNQNQGFGGGQQQQNNNNQNRNQNQNFGGGQQQQSNNYQNNNQNFGGGQQQGNRQFPPVDGGTSPRPEGSRNGYDGGEIPPDGMSADEYQSYRNNVGDNSNFKAPVPPPQLPRGDDDELPF